MIHSLQFACGHCRSLLETSAFVNFSAVADRGAAADASEKVWTGGCCLALPQQGSGGVTARWSSEKRLRRGGERMGQEIAEEGRMRGVCEWGEVEPRGEVGKRGNKTTKGKRRDGRRGNEEMV